MMNEPIISIIMPVYNVASYISRAIDSVLAQTYKEFELIIINAGSQDDTGVICSKYSNEDERIKYIELVENIGPGPGRNIGLEMAKGQYIMFMDGDDHIEPDMLQTMYGEMQTADLDMVVCGYYQDFVDEKEEVENSIEVLPPSLKTHSKEETLKNIPAIDVAKVLSFSWNKLYKTEIIKRHNLVFPDKLHSEDYFFIIEYFKYVNTVKTVEKAFYHYIKRNVASLTNQKYHKNFLELMQERFHVQVELLKEGNQFEGKTREIACSEHVKNIFLALENECAKESGLTAKQRREKIAKLLAEPYTQEAIKYSGDITKVIMLLNRVIRTKNAGIIDFFAYIIWFMRNKMAKVYHKMKTK